MTNRERYKKAFSALHASDQTLLTYGDMESMDNINSMNYVNHINRRKNLYMKKVLAASAALVVTLGSMTAAYAADLGGIQEKLTMWFRGEETEVTASKHGDYSYKYTFTDSDGESQEFVAGGVTLDDMGNEHAISAQELLDEFTDEVIYADNGKILFFYYDGQKKIDITNLFDEDGICRIAIEDGKKTFYYTIEDNGDDCAAYEKTDKPPKDAEHYTVVVKL